MKVKELEARLFEIYPKELAAEYDNIGLILGDAEAEVSGVVIALDLVNDAIVLAKEKGANVIVTHHPAIFSGIKNIYKGSAVYLAIENGISVIAMHTNFDSAKGGLCDILAEKIGFENTLNFKTSDGTGIRTVLMDSPISADELASVLKEKLVTNVKYVVGKEIKKIAICSGNGSGFWDDVKTSDADAYICGELKHHMFLEALEKGISLFDCGHFETEIICLETLERIVKEIGIQNVSTLKFNKIKSI